jgi:hypothetical protein
MKFEQTKTLANLRYISTFLENPDFVLPDDVLENFERKSNSMVKQLKSFLKNIEKLEESVELSNQFKK